MTTGTATHGAGQMTLNQSIANSERLPTTSLQSTHTAIARLCDMLEAVADSLPANVDRRLCQRLADELMPSLKSTQEFEEVHVFPAIRRTAAGQSSVATVLDQLQYEHFEDLCFAEEAADVLRRLGNGGQVNMEAVGYMLRGLFSALRRHMSFEQEFVGNGLHN